MLHLGSLFEREEVRDLLALLSLAVDRNGDALVRVASMPRYGVGLQDVHVATRHLRSNGGWALAGLGSLAEADGISERRSSGFQTARGGPVRTGSVRLDVGVPVLLPA